MICLPRLPAELFESTPSQDRSGAESSSYKPSEVISAVEAVNEPNLKLIFDPSHAYLTSVKGVRQTGEKEILPGGVIEYIHMMGHHIGYVHMVDTSGKLSELDNAHTSDHLPLGEGILDLDAIIDALWPYAGHLPYWSLDFYACRDAEHTAIESLKILREKVQKRSANAEETGI